MMKKVSKAISLFMMILLVSQEVFGQSDAPSYPKNFISTNLLKPLFQRFTFRYERMITQNDAIRFDFEYKYPRNESYENVTSMFIKINNQGSVKTYYAFSAGYGRYIFPKVGFYIAAELMYRYSYYEQVIYYDCVGTYYDSNVYLESMYAYDFGIKPQVGIKLQLTKDSPVKLFFDFYAGPITSLRYQIEITHAEGHGTCSAGDLVPNTPEEKETRLGPNLSFNLGVNFTVAF